MDRQIEKQKRKLIMFNKKFLQTSTLFGIFSASLMMANVPEAKAEVACSCTITGLPHPPPYKPGETITCAGSKEQCASLCKQFKDRENLSFYAAYYKECPLPSTCTRDDNFPEYIECFSRNTNGKQQFQSVRWTLIGEYGLLGPVG